MLRVLLATLVVSAAQATCVDGPTSSTDKAIARFDGTTGLIIQNSFPIIGDNGDISELGDITANGTLLMDLQLKNGAYVHRLQEGTPDPFGRRQMWYMATNAAYPDGVGGSYAGTGGVFRMGSLGADGDPTNIISEGIVVYGQDNAAGPMTSANWGYARVKPMRFALTESIASVETTIFRTNPSELLWRPSGGAADAFRVTSSAATFTVEIESNAAGAGISIKEGSNARMGTVALVLGAATVSTTAITSAGRVFVTSQADGGVPGYLRVTNIVAGTSFKIISSKSVDTSTVAWMIVNAA